MRNSFPVEYSVLSADDARKDSPDARHRCHFVVVNVPRFLTNDFLPGVRLGEDASEISHAARRNKEGGLAPENLGGTFLQAVHGRIFDENIVPDFRFRHGSTHFRGRFCDSVAS